MKSWIAESDYLFHNACVPRRRPSMHLQDLQGLVGETDQNASAAGPPSKPEEYRRVNTFFTSLDKVLAEIEDRFSGNDQDVLCALGDVTKSDSPASDSFDLVADYYHEFRQGATSGRPTSVQSIQENTFRKINKDSGRSHQCIA